MTYTAPAVGSKVTVALTGFVEFADESSIHLYGGLQIESNSCFEDDGDDVTVTVLEETPAHGDVGIFHDYLSKRVVALYRREADPSACGWFSPGGHKVPPTKVRRLSKEQLHDLLFSQDAVKLPSDKAAGGKLLAEAMETDPNTIDTGRRRTPRSMGMGKGAPADLSAQS